jgi:L,D-transpeptidase ErfK/SrfK
MIFHRFFDGFRFSNRLHLAILLLILLSMPGCANVRGFLNDSLPFPMHTADGIERNDFVAANGDDVVGRLATMRVESGDTLPDIARHFSLGLNTVSAANPGVDTWVPEAGERILLPMSFILPDTPKKGIVINLAAMRLFHYQSRGDRLAVSTYPVGVGTEERPSPMGKMYISRKKHRPTWYVPASIAADHRKKGDPLPPSVPPGPLNPLGEYALYLSRITYLIHGTNKPASVGLRATNGCIRLYPEDIERLFGKTPVKTPVKVVNQPYLVGRRDGIVYLEAHPPFDKTGKANWKRIYAKLQKIEKQSGRVLDWKKVKDVVIEARGYPVPVSFGPDGRGVAVAEPLKIWHPRTLYGQPEVPEYTLDAWYVLAATLRDKSDARRLAAIINHQGPPIPARVLSQDDRHRVLAGPFDSKREARKAAKRLKIDLELDGVVFES